MKKAKKRRQYFIKDSKNKEEAMEDSRSIHKRRYRKEVGRIERLEGGKGGRIEDIN